jgi:hypothetical protein
MAISSVRPIRIEEICEVLRVRRSLAARVHSAEFYSAHKWDEPAVLRAGDVKFDCETVAETIATGVTMLAGWTGVQGGPGAVPWSAKLQGWLDDLESDFGSADDGDELQGYGRLVAMLENLFKDISSSPSLQ